MNKIEFALLNDAIIKYKTLKIDEKQFHQSLETVIPLLTEFDSYDLRLELEIIENKLEKIDFSSTPFWKDYLIEIEKIETLLKKIEIH